MDTRFRTLVMVTVAGAVLAAAAPAPAVAPYPTVPCVAGKLEAAAAACKTAFQAWAAWEKQPDDVKRVLALAKVGRRLAAAWTKLEARAAKKGAECADTTLSSSAMGALIETGVAGLADDVNAGLDLAGSKSDRKCAARVLDGAAGACEDLLKVESRHLQRLTKEPNGGTKRDAFVHKALVRFESTFTNATRHGCPTTATPTGASTALDALHAGVLANAIVSPNVPRSWTTITPPGEVPYLGRTYKPICSRGTPYVYFAKRGTVNNLLVYYQGGGACFDFLTCSPGIGAFADTATESDNPAHTTTGFGDFDNPDNPFRDWNAVFVTYCTGDIHWGDATVTYTNGSGGSFDIEHRGFVNARVVEKFAREHFVAPDRVFVSGSSAGAYGAIMGGVYLKEMVYPTARFDVVGDAGNGVVTPQFLVDNIQNWGVEPNLPRWIEGLDKPIPELSIDQLWAASANQYASDRFAQYTSAYDGGLGSQSFFYNVMVHLTDLSAWLAYWNVTCDWNARMRDLAQSTAAAAPTNYRYYIGAGSRHTIWGSNKVYTDNKGGVPHFAAWVRDMLDGGILWANVECTDCSLLPGTCSAGSDTPGVPCQDDTDCPNGTCTGEDVRPSPLAAPFGPGGTVTCP